jgi:hypothetical protein
VPIKLPDEVRERFRRYGRQGGKARAARLSPEAKRAVSQRAAATRWIRKRFGDSSFAALGLPGGEAIDIGLADLAAGRTSLESLLVSVAAPRLRREGIPVGETLANAEDQLYDMLVQTSGDLAHARYLAWLKVAESFANACGTARRDRKGRAN